MIEIQNLTRRYGKTVAVDGVSFKIRNGHMYGLVGPDGAGKSTIMSLIAGALIPSEGTVLVNGYDIRKSPMEAKRQIGYLPEELPLSPDMTPAEYLTFLAEIKGMEEEQLDRRVREVMELMELTRVKDALIRHLPKGMRRRVGIAQTLLGNPDMILLDEPTADLEPIQRNELRALIRRLGEKRTILLSAPTFAELGGMCDHVIVLAEGRVVSDEDVEVQPLPSAPVEDDKAPEAESLDADTSGVPSALSDEEVSD